MAVAPGTPLTVAVARSVALGTLSPYGQYNTASSPSALEVFDDAVARPYSDVDLANANSLAWAERVNEFGTTGFTSLESKR
jgi:hypothetical protein